MCQDKEQLVEQTKRAIERAGNLTEASRLLGIPRATLSAVACGSPVREGTLLRVAQALASL